MSSLRCLHSQLGGTVGDIESAPFVEAMRQFQFRVGHENFALIHVSLVPDMHGEQKTKPTQTTVHALRGLGLLPDLVCKPANRFLAPELNRFLADCMSCASTATAPSGHQGQDIHVLSCVLGAGFWNPRSFLHIPCPPSPRISGHHTVSPEKIKSPQYQHNASHERSGFFLEGALALNDQGVSSDQQTCH